MKKATKPIPTTIDEYLDDLPTEVRSMLETLRSTIQLAAPKAEEVISYRMPAFKYHGMLVYFAAFKNHCSFFPANSTLLAKMKEELKSYKNAKGTVQFTVENPLPSALVKKIVKARMKENEERMAVKKLTLSAKKKTSKGSKKVSIK